jgi:CBS domain-containing protein
MNVGQVMTTHIVTVPRNTPVVRACQIMLEERLSGLPVVDAGGMLVGMVTEGDIMRCFELREQRKVPPPPAAAGGGQRRDWLVADIMSKPVVTIAEDATIGQLATLLDQHRIRRVPVMRAETLVGVASRADLLRALLDLPPS